MAQLVRASPCHGEGRRFESDLGRYNHLGGCATIEWGLSSAGRASALQAEGHRFEPYRPHLFMKNTIQIHFKMYLPMWLNWQSS